MKTIIQVPVKKGQYGVYFYLYKIVNDTNGHFYYGVHQTKKLPDHYKGSGLRLKSAIKKYGIGNFTKYILEFFDDSEEALNREREIVNEDLVKDKNCYNLALGGASMTFNTVTVHNGDGNFFRVPITDPRYLKGELFGTTKGFKVGVDINTGKASLYPLKDPRWATGEIHHPSKGMVSVKDKDGNNLYVSADDPRLESGEFIHVTKGTIPVKDKNGKIFRVDKNDPRWKRGELVSASIGKIVAKDKKGNTMIVDKDDPRWKRGELVGVIMGKVNVVDVKTGRRIQVDKNDPRLKTGELISTTKNHIWINKDGIQKTVHKDELDKYISDGWRRGQLHRQKSGLMVFVNNGNVNKYIHKDELDKYISDGWRRGFVQNLNKGREWYTNGSENHFLLPTEAQKLDQSWHKGMTRHKDK